MTRSAHTNQNSSLRIIPIIYGNTSVPKPDSDLHLWTVYLRHAEDPNYTFPFLSHVRFCLHESFGDQANVTVAQPPYEVSREGWGEFEILIQLFASRNDKKPVCTINHVLRLFGKTESLVFEVYDELILCEKDNVVQSLTEGRAKPLSIEPIREKLLPVALKSEFEGIEVDNLDEMLHKGDSERYKLLEQLRLAQLRRSRENIEKEIKLMERKVRELS